MKRTFIKMLPLVAAVLLATSCSKDGNDDSNVVIDNPVETQNVASPDNDGVTIVPLTITVNKDGNSLSKATVDVTPGEDGKNIYTQKFVAGDVLIIYNDDVLQSEATFTLKSEDIGKSTATFEGSLSVKNGVTLEKGTTKLNAILGTKDEDGMWKNDGYGIGEDADGNPYVGTAETLAEAFETYGRLTAENFTYNGNETSISLTQETVFLRVKPFYGTTTATINGKTYTAQSDGVIYLAVASGTPIESNLFSGTKIVTNANGKVVKNIDRSDYIAGVFSVSADKQIFFSKGNLQYYVPATNETPQWRFAEHQYDKCHNSSPAIDNVGKDYKSWSGKWTDLFGWGMWLDGVTWEGGTYNDYIKPLNTSNTSPNGYLFVYGDKNNKIYFQSDLNDKDYTKKGSGWYTLSTAEWQYLLNNDGTRADKNGIGTITDQYGNTYFGLIIVPDGYTDPEGVKFVPGNNNTTYSATDWSKMESAGAVFLPAAGSRNGASVTNAGTSGFYWSSSVNSESIAYCLKISSNGTEPAAKATRCYGCSVRLVRSL